jgi:hypothetical protein
MIDGSGAVAAAQQTGPPLVVGPDEGAGTQVTRAT